jgi:trimeric autotransporter adhesin
MPRQVLRLFRTRELHKSNRAGNGRKTMKPLIQLRKTIPLIYVAIVLGSVGVLSTAQAVVPPPDGGYPNFTTAEGQNALKNLTTGAANTAVGWYSLFTDTSGSFNTGVGAGTLVLNTGDDNTATGVAALLLNTTGADNTANGTATLVNNSTGGNNTAVGSFALNSNSTAFNNTAVGAGALRANTTGQSNTATGVGALISNIDGGGNTATGVFALNANDHGALNTATGVAALQSNTAGDDNTAMGAGALNFNTIGSENTAVGQNALQNNIDGSENTAIGVGALAANLNSNANTAIGTLAGGNITGQFNICIGAGVQGVGGDNTIRIGDNLPDTQGDSACYIGGIYNQLGEPATFTSVGIDALGKLATASSSRRFKRDIKPMDEVSEAILALKPVTFHYKRDSKNTPCFGLIAEEVAEVDPDLVVRDKDGEISTVRYDQVNAMLLNEFLKEHRKVGALEVRIAKQRKDFEAEIIELKREIQTLVARLNQHDAEIQSVRAEIETNNNTPRVVANEP